MNTSSGIGVSTESDDTMNDDNPVAIASTVKEGVTPSVIDMMEEKEKISSLEDDIVLESFPSSTTPVTTIAGNAPGKSSYANITCKPSGKKVNVRTLFTHNGNGIDVVVSVDSMHTISERFANTAYDFFLGKKVAYPVVANYSSFAKVVIELRADIELKDHIVMAMPKITKEGHYTCNVRIEYDWKPPRCSTCKVFGNIHKKCPKNTGVGEKKIVKMPSQTYRGVLKGVKPTIEVSNSNPFDVLNLVDNDVEFGTNTGNTNLVINEATSSGFSFMNINNDEEFSSNTPIREKIDKIKRKICDGKLRLLDNDGNLLVPTGIVESYSEVEVVFDETANLRISKSGKDGSDKGYGTNSLLEQWRDSYLYNDDYDPYDDDMYENHDLSEHLQSICNDLDITHADKDMYFAFAVDIVVQSCFLCDQLLACPLGIPFLRTCFCSHHDTMRDLHLNMRLA
uniref:DUF4283 domain-containing protein n=1 Tax=Tanacetum cinerariifolium TaxID=118510 RepID=A0A6L2KT48_TANCI|nr:hypothetical protein [Tanacetum cinerariifolium]